MNIRKFIYFLTDNNGKVRRQLAQIKKANEDDEFAERLREECIAKLIKHVRATVPFYKGVTSDRFEDLPIVDKVMMKEDIQKFRSEADVKIGKIRHTSGSTGIPFEILQDERKAKRIEAELIYCRELTKDELGTKFINLLSPSRMEKTTRLSQIKQNVVAFDVTRMDSATLEKLHIILSHDRKIKYMLAYASALEKVANYFEEKGYNERYSLKAVVSSSEVLTDRTMQKLISVFGCPVYDRYSNEDNGFIAQTDGKSHDFFVNRGSYFIEILKMDSDEPAKENEMGRIVITDYYNYAQPFLRYDTGDLGAYSYKLAGGANRYVLTKLAGRISDIVYDAYDNPVSTFAIGNVMEVFTKIKQYQLIQEAKRKFILNITDPCKHYKDEEYKKALTSVLKGGDMSLTVNYPDTLPTLSSGKFQRVICRYEPLKNDNGV